jgi:16S rRNA processing protein RimM
VQRPDKLVAIAHLHRARGIKGEVIAESLTSHPERFAALGRVFLVKPGAAEAREADVERVWDFRGSPVFKFRGIDTMTVAETLRGYDVSVPEEERVALPEGEYFLSDLVGCRMTAAGSGDLIGIVTGWFENGPQDVLEVRPENEAQGEPILVPFVKAFFTVIDPAGKSLVVELPEGLKELNR